MNRATQRTARYKAAIEAALAGAAGFVPTQQVDNVEGATLGSTAAAPPLGGDLNLGLFATGMFRARRPSGRRSITCAKSWRG